MNGKNIAGKLMLTFCATALALALSACYGIPKGTMKDARAGDVQLSITGAGIVKADAQKTTFKINCAVCGYQSEEMVVDTPTTGKPYTMEWVCPKCGHKQKIVIQVSGQ